MVFGRLTRPPSFLYPFFPIVRFHLRFTPILSYRPLVSSSLWGSCHKDRWVNGNRLGGLEEAGNYADTRYIRQATRGTERTGDNGSIMLGRRRAPPKSFLLWGGKCKRHTINHARSCFWQETTFLDLAKNFSNGSKKLLLGSLSDLLDRKVFNGVSILLRIKIGEYSPVFCFNIGTIEQA